ncbi:Rieske (2Fe-2S) protein, partial [Nocardioides sp. 616]|uniref:Rieske (2Fe-2S) protein n=1 Tax=Nocardioides sp. 616 TaxID=2268090 RepID=UPI001964CD9B
MNPRTNIDGPSRRAALAGAALTGIGIPLLSACGGDGDDTAEDHTAVPDEAPPSGVAVASTADIGVGACAVYPDLKLVVAQPAEGEFKCFSAVCTHQGCLVSSSSEGEIPCRCHGSAFSLEDGSVLEGPATSPLTEVP